MRGGDGRLEPLCVNVDERGLLALGDEAARWNAIVWGGRQEEKSVTGLAHWSQRAAMKVGLGQARHHAYLLQGAG